MSLCLCCCASSPYCVLFLSVSSQVRFCGFTEFATGLWLGLELDEPKGKHDGSNKRKRLVGRVFGSDNLTAISTPIDGI